MGDTGYSMLDTGTCCTMVKSEVQKFVFCASMNRAFVILFQLSDNMQHMWEQFEKSKHRQSGQLDFPFQFDDQGNTKESLYDEKDQSDFNKKLTTALNYNPKEEKDKASE